MSLSINAGMPRSAGFSIAGSATNGAITNKSVQTTPDLNSLGPDIQNQIGNLANSLLGGLAAMTAPANAAGAAPAGAAAQQLPANQDLLSRSAAKPAKPAPQEAEAKDPGAGGGGAQASSLAGIGDMIKKIAEVAPQLIEGIMSVVKAISPSKG